MKRLFIIAALVLGGCGAITAHKNNGRAPMALYLVDAAVFSVGMCVGMDAQYGSPPHDDRGVRMLGGYGAAMAAWLPYWFVKTR